MSEGDQLNLSAIRAEPIESDGSDDSDGRDFDLQEKFSKLDREEQRDKLNFREQDQNIDSRRKYARCVFVLLCVWISSVMATVIASGYDKCPIHLSDSVLIALISGISVSVIGLFAIVANYLFPKQ